MLNLLVYGRFWNGAHGVYSYTIDEAPADTDEASRLAGDFATVLDWKVIRSTTERQRVRSGIDRTVATRKTLRGWRNGMRDERYCRLMFD